MHTTSMHYTHIIYTLVCMHMNLYTHIIYTLDAVFAAEGPFECSLLQWKRKPGHGLVIFLERRFILVRGHENYL
jgi:hypothetical protein